MKLYSIYYKNLKTEDLILYAWTTEKSRMDAFMNERNSEVFRVKKRKMDKLEFETNKEYQDFQKMYSTSKLIDGLLTDGVRDIRLQMTIAETQSVSAIMDNIEDSSCHNLKLLDHHWFNKKFNDVLTDLNKISKMDETEMRLYSIIDSFQIFVDHFGYTL